MKERKHHAFLQAVALPESFEAFQAINGQFPLDVIF